MSLFVEMPVVFTRHATVFLRRDYRYSALLEDKVDEVLGVVGLVSGDMVSRNPLNQFGGRHNVVNLAPGEFQTNGVAQGINDGMNFGR